jgi:hypothetical protein
MATLNIGMELEPLEPQYFECACHSPEHTLRFCWDDKDNEIYTEVFLNQYHNFFKRIWIALKYVFGYKCKYGQFDCFLMQPKDAQRLKSLLDKIGM